MEFSLLPQPVDLLKLTQIHRALVVVIFKIETSTYVIQLDIPLTVACIRTCELICFNLV